MTPYCTFFYSADSCLVSCSDQMNLLLFICLLFVWLDLEVRLEFDVEALWLYVKFRDSYDNKWYNIVIYYK